MANKKDNEKKAGFFEDQPIWMLILIGLICFIIATIVLLILAKTVFGLDINSIPFIGHMISSLLEDYISVKVPIKTITTDATLSYTVPSEDILGNVLSAPPPLKVEATVKG